MTTDAVRTITLPEELCRAAEARFSHRFATFDELISELLKQLICDDPLAIDEKEQHIIEERLKGLGYI